MCEEIEQVEKMLIERPELRPSYLIAIEKHSTQGRLPKEIDERIAAVIFLTEIAASAAKARNDRAGFDIVLSEAREKIKDLTAAFMGTSADQPEEVVHDGNAQLTLNDQSQFKGDTIPPGKPRPRPKKKSAAEKLTFGGATSLDKTTFQERSSYRARGRINFEAFERREIYEEAAYKAKMSIGGYFMSLADVDNNLPPSKRGYGNVRAAGSRENAALRDAKNCLKKSANFHAVGGWIDNLLLCFFNADQIGGFISLSHAHSQECMDAARGIAQLQTVKVGASREELGELLKSVVRLADAETAMKVQIEKMQDPVCRDEGARQVLNGLFQHCVAARSTVSSYSEKLYSANKTL